MFGTSFPSNPTLLVLLKQPPDVFYEKKIVVKNFAYSTGKQLCQSHLFTKVAV